MNPFRGRLRDCLCGFPGICMIFFFGTIISGSQAIIVLCMPLAFAAEPQAGLALFLLLMGMTYAAMQISPTMYALQLCPNILGWVWER